MKRHGISTIAKVLLVVLLLGGLAACRREEAGGAAATQGAALFTCPMHPDYTSDRQGDCPICGMRLVPVAGVGRDPASPPPAHEGAPASSIEPERWAAAVRRPAAATLRLSGRVAIDDRRIEHVHSRVEGVIERVFVEVVGTSVRRGQPLVEISSPEVLASEAELVAAVASERDVPADAPEWVRDDARALVEAARRRLALWEVPAADVREVEETGRASRIVTIRAPADGVVTMREAFHHSRAITAETELYTIVDFSHVFVVAQAFEQDAPRIRVGDAAEVRVPGDPGPPRTAPVSFVAPYADAATRTVSVRLELANGDGLLRPEGVVDVIIRQDLGEQVVVPEEAIVDSGLAQRVFVEGPGGAPRIRRIVAGPAVEGGRVVLSGLEAGERVVAAAGFLVDSESRLSGAIEEEPSPPAATPAAPVDGRDDHGMHRP